MGYWSYYLISFALAYATQNPAAAVLALGFWLCRGVLPDPGVWLRTMGRIRKLNAEIAPPCASVPRPHPNPFPPRAVLLLMTLLTTFVRPVIEMPPPYA